MSDPRSFKPPLYNLSPIKSAGRLWLESHGWDWYNTEAAVRMAAELAAEDIHRLEKEITDCRACDEIRGQLAACQKRYGYALDDGRRKSAMYNELEEKFTEVNEQLARAQAVQKKDRDQYEKIFSVLRAGPRAEYWDHGPERGQDYFYPGEDTAQFHSRIIKLLRHFDTQVLAKSVTKATGGD